MQAPSRPAQRPDEIFDIVNEQDEIVGQATRQEAHARGLLHRATHVLVFNSAGQVYLQKRSMAKDTAPGCWESSCSGHVDSGESYRTTAARELAEEIGVKAQPHDLIFHLQLPPCADTGWEFVSIFSLRYDGPVSPDPVEVERGEWLEPEELTRALAARPHEFTKPLRLHWPIVRARLHSGKV